MSLQIFHGVDDSGRHGAAFNGETRESNAMAPFYAEEEWQWRRCCVLSFCSSNNKYRVKFLVNGLEKDVKRSNLLFDDESRDTWQTCRDAASAAREDAKRRLRFDYFVSQQPMAEVRAVQGSTIRRIHARVADGLPLDVAFPQPRTKLGNLLRKLTKEIIQQHTRSMRKSTLFHKLMHSERDKARYDQLGLLPMPEARRIPWSGKVVSPQHSYIEKKKASGNIHCSSLPEVRPWSNCAFNENLRHDLNPLLCQYNGITILS